MTQPPKDLEAISNTPACPLFLIGRNSIMPWDTLLPLSLEAARANSIGALIWRQDAGGCSNLTRINDQVLVRKIESALVQYCTDGCVFRRYCSLQVNTITRKKESWYLLRNSLSVPGATNSSALSIFLTCMAECGRMRSACSALVYF